MEDYESKFINWKMCGLAVCLSADIEFRNSFLNDALKLLHHRGPDDQGRWDSEVIGIAHTRLAILDLSEAGHQPMVSNSGRYVIVYNGEIYNHLQLRKRFLNNYRFKGHSDTETLLTLYEELGSKMLQYLVGMWAMVIWDTASNSLFISRDRFGQKPLYWAIVNNSLLLSSEITPILKVIPKREYNELAVSEYLATGNYDHLFDQTFFNGIFSFLPSHFSHVDFQKLEITPEKYWQIEDVPYRERIPVNKIVLKDFRELVITAVESQLLSDVPVGATLSGGLDSSIIASSIAHLGKKNFPLFTAQFSGENDESKYVRSLEKKWGNALDVIFTPVSEMDLKQDLAKILRIQEEPFGDPSIMAHSFLVDAAKTSGVKVLLGGQGGDEVSMGYPWMQNRLFAYALNNRDWKLFLQYVFQNRTDLRNFLRLILASTAPAWEQSLRMKARLKLKNKLNHVFQIPSMNRSFGTVREFSGIYLESLFSVGLPHLCHYDDRSTMARSIEGRMPFLDHRLLDFTSKLKPDAFYENGYTKNIFRLAFKDLLPQEVLNRKDKIGFYTPIRNLVMNNANWFKSLIFTEKSEFFSEDYQRLLCNSMKSKILDLSMAIDIFRLGSIILWKDNMKIN